MDRRNALLTLASGLNQLFDTQPSRGGRFTRSHKAFSYRTAIPRMAAVSCRGFFQACLRCDLPQAAASRARHASGEH